MCPFGARLWPTLCKQVDVRRVIVLEEEGARGARHALHGGGTHDAVLLVAAERVSIIFQRSTGIQPKPRALS